MNRHTAIFLRMVACIRKKSFPFREHQAPREEGQRDRLAIDGEVLGPNPESEEVRRRSLTLG
jgi:hypothetical protein